jgi:acetyl-CoA C-acetyltransferase
MSAQEIVIVSAARTAVGSFNGAFANTPAHDLGAEAVKAAIARAGIEAVKFLRRATGRIQRARLQ